MKEHYYSVEHYELEELLSFLKDCARRYKGLNLKIAAAMTSIWVVTNKDLYVPLQKEFKYKYKELKTKPNPQKRWNISWIDYKVKIKHLNYLMQ